MRGLFDSFYFTSHIVLQLLNFESSTSEICLIFNLLAAWINLHEYIFYCTRLWDFNNVLYLLQITSDYFEKYKFS